MYLGIELGSTRIKAVTVDNITLKPEGSGAFSWASTYENGFWTYPLPLAIEGVKSALRELKELSAVTAAGISGMMHGYLAFDENWNLLTPFRTWQNIDTDTAASELTSLLGYTIPNRWSVTHLYQAILNNEPHLKRLCHLTTLSGYIHFMLTGQHVLGLCEASGMFPVDPSTLDYDEEMLKKTEALFKKHNFTKKLRDLLPACVPAGEKAGTLTKEGAALIDGLLPVGLPFCAPEGDGGTGMIATDSVKALTGNVSAGTSIFACIVLDKPLKNFYPAVNNLLTPDGKPVIIVQSSNCTTDLNAWAYLIKEAVGVFGKAVSDDELFTTLYSLSLEGEKDAGGAVVLNYVTGEALTDVKTGIPMVMRTPGASFNLKNFFRAHIYSAIATLKIGMEMLNREDISISSLTGHGGLFKTKNVGTKFLAAALNTNITTLSSSGEGGAYGIALLAAYTEHKAMALDEFLSLAFSDASKEITVPEKEDIEGFNEYMKNFKMLLNAEKAILNKGE